VGGPAVPAVGPVKAKEDNARLRGRLRTGQRMAEKHFGHVAGALVGQEFRNRTALANAAVHPPLMSGIHGTSKDGTDSIVVSGGYPDDEDLGDVIIYTGAGGNDPQTKRQIADQALTQPGNAGLVTSQLRGLPVRVSRGAHRGSEHAPATGFRYDGLYAVVDHSSKIGKDGFRVWLFRLEKLPDDQPSIGPAPASDAPSYATTTVTRRVRDSAQARAVKAWHDDRCQVCGVVIEIEGGRRYSEGAHIRPLGRPSDGPDHTSNLLCLCPNHHAQLDYGGLIIDHDLTIRDRHNNQVIGRLRLHPQHKLDADALDYRRSLHP
jgi:putative restriction endonuclease